MRTAQNILRNVKKVSRKPASELSGKARQVLDAIYRLGEASAADILQHVREVPTYSAARSILRSLFHKGYIKRREREFKYVYFPAVPRESASKSALQHLLETFFDGSPEKTMKALLDLSQSEEYEIDFKKFENLIEQAKKEGR